MHSWNWVADKRKGQKKKKKNEALVQIGEDTDGSGIYLAGVLRALHKPWEETRKGLQYITAVLEYAC